MHGCLSSEWPGWHSASDGGWVDDDGVGTINVVDHANGIGVTVVQPLIETSTLYGDHGVDSASESSVVTPDGSDVEDLRSPSESSGGSGGVASIEIDVDALVGVGSGSPQGLDSDGGVSASGSTLTVDGSKSDSEVVGQERISETNTLYRDLSVWRVISSWSDWSLSWGGGSDDWAISVASASKNLGLVLAHSIEEEIHGGRVTKVSVSTQTISWCQVEVGSGGSSSSGRRDSYCGTILFPIAGSSSARNTEGRFDGLSSPISVLETSTSQGHSLTSTKVTEGGRNSGTQWSPVVLGSSRGISDARCIKTVVDLVLLVPSVGWNSAGDGCLTIADGSVGSEYCWDVVVAQVGSEQSRSTASNLVTSHGCGSGNRPRSSGWSQREDVQQWTPPPVVAVSAGNLSWSWESVSCWKTDLNWNCVEASGRSHTGTGDDVVANDVDGGWVAKVG